MNPGSAPTGEWPVVERTSVADAISRGLNKRPFPAVALVGATGIGKSTLARSVAEGRSGSTVEIVGIEELRAVPLGAFAPLLSSDLWHSSDLSMRLSDVVTTIAALSPALIFVDDAPLLDDISAAAIYQLIRVHKIPCLLTVRDEHGLSGPLQRLEHEGVLERITLGPLSAVEIENVLERRFGEIIEPESVRALHARSGGNPLLLRTLALAVEEQGTLHGGSLGLVLDEPVLPRHTLDVMRARLAPLADSDRALAELVALVQPVPGALIPADTPLDLLVARGLLSREADQVRVFHPLAAQVLLDDLVGPTRTTRVDEAANLLLSSPDPQLRFRGTLLLVRNSHRVSATDLAWAAGFAHAAQDHALTVRLAQQSLDQETSFEALVALGSALSALGDAAATGVLDDALMCATTDTQRAIGALRWGAHRALRLGEPAEAATELSSLLSTITDPSARSIIEPDIAKWRSMAGEALPSVSDRETAPVGGIAELSALIGQAMIASMQADTAATSAASRAARPLATEHLAEFPVAHDLLDLNDFLVLVFEGRLEEAEKFARARHDRPRGDATGLWSYTLGLVALHTGRASAALPLAEVAVAVAELALRDFTGLHGSAIALLATANAQLGLDSFAEDQLSASQRQDIKVHLQLAEAEAWRNARKGDLDRAAAVLVAVATQGVAANHSALAALTAATACRFGRGAEVESLLREIAEETDSPLIATLACAASAQAVARPDQLAAAAARLMAVGFRASAMEAWELAARGEPHRETKRSHEIAARRCSEGLNLLSILRPAVAQEALTDRELLIAQAAAARRRSHEIAADLGLSVRTIDNNLGRVYRKLGVHNRLELAAALQQLGE